MINFHPDQSFRKLSESAWWPLGRGVYLGVKTSELFPRCFLSNIFLGSIVLTSHSFLCIHRSTSLVSFTGFYTEDEPRRGPCDHNLLFLTDLAVFDLFLWLLADSQTFETWRPYYTAISQVLVAAISLIWYCFQMDKKLFSLLKLTGVFKVWS